MTDEPKVCVRAVQQAAKGQGELERFEAAIQKHNAEIERVMADAASAEAAVAQVEQELSDVGGQPMREQREQVEVLKKVLSLMLLTHCSRPTF